MEIVENWRFMWRWASVRFQAAAIAVQTTWASLSDDMRSNFPKHAVTALTIGLLVMGVGGRLVKQDSPSSDSGKDGNDK